MKSIIMTLLLSTMLYSASFDCSKATSTIEKSICKNKELGNLDIQLSNDYSLLQNALKKDDFKEIKIQQRQWLKSLKSVCKNPLSMENCLIDEYKQRISELNKTQDNLITTIKKLELELKELTNKNINEYHETYLVNDERFALILRVSILKRDYKKILALSHKSINISESMYHPVNVYSNNKPLEKIDSVEKLKTFFDRLFPEKLRKDLLLNEFKVTIVGPHNSNAIFDYSIYELGEFEFLRRSSIYFTHNFLIMDIYNQLNSLIFDQDLVTLEKSLIRAKNRLDYSGIQSDAIDKKVQHLGKECTKALDTKKCLKNRIILLTDKINVLLKKHEKPFNNNEFNKYISKLKIKGFINDRTHGNSMGPEPDEELKFDFRDFDFIYLGSVLPSINNRIDGLSIQVQTVNSIAHIFVDKNKNLLLEDDGAWYNSIILINKGGKNNFYLAELTFDGEDTYNLQESLFTKESFLNQEKIYILSIAKMNEDVNQK